MNLVCTLLMGLVVSTAFAQEANKITPASTAADEAQAPIGASDQAAPAQTAPQEASASDTEILADSENAAAVDLVALQKAGYKLVNENGVTLFCKKEPILGSRLRYETRCLTAAEAEQERRAASDAMSDMSRKVQNPPGD